jgi:fluoroquinolone resistance protein
MNAINKSIEDNTQYYLETFNNLSNTAQLINAVEFVECTFNNCNFSESTFKHCLFEKCKFVDCNLSLVKIQGSRFLEVSFIDSKLIGINWSEGVFKTKSLLQRKPFDFDHCVLNHCVFFGLDLKEIKMSQCSLINANFEEADLSKADCTKSDFKNTQFNRTNLTETNFNGATNYSISSQANTLKKTRFSLPEAISLLYNLDIVLEDMEITE